VPVSVSVCEIRICAMCLMCVFVCKLCVCVCMRPLPVCVGSDICSREIFVVLGCASDVCRVFVCECLCQDVKCVLVEIYVFYM